MSIANTAERKRLESLKKRKQAFQQKEQVIRKALANLDSTSNNRKIIFDDDLSEQQNLKPEEKKKDLFEDDDNDGISENPVWNEDFYVKKHKKVILGHDERFTLDKRFVDHHEDESETKVIGNTDECDLQKEKERELNILESVLGTPLTKKIPEEAKNTFKQGFMIRYDPTEEEHCEYEVKPTQSQTKEDNVKKKKHEKIRVEEPAPVEVSKDIYYSVSNILTESLKNDEKFSLLKAFSREKSNVDDSNAQNCDTDVSGMKNDMDKNFRFHFSAKDVFEHDSSDNENENKIFDADEGVTEQPENNDRTNSLFGYKDTLFFDNNDVRFNEAVRFFNTEVTSNDEFKNLRRELKMIVRTKIRRNERKYQPWNKKRKIKRQ